MAGTNNRVLIELYVDDQGTVKIREAKAALQELGQAGKQGFADSASSADDFASSLVKQLGIYALVISAAYKLERAIVGGFKAGIQAVDNYKISVIAIAASLTDMAKPGQGDMSELFQRNAASAEAMYRAINVEAAKHFAGAHEMMMVYNRLVQGGYNVRLEEVQALGTLADKIRIATQGQQQEVQLNQEVRALLEGQARGYSMLAMELQTRLGPEWSTLLEKHKAAGTLLQWLTSLWPGLQVATGKVTETITSQWTTLKSIAELLAIDSLGGAYQEIVDYMKDINKYLRENKQFLSSDIVQAWDTVKIAVGGVTEAVKILIAEINMISLGALEKLPGMIQGASLYLKDMKKESWIGERTQSRYEGMMQDEKPAGIWTATQGMLGHTGANQALARSRQLMEAARATAEQEWAAQNPNYDLLPGLASAGRFSNKPVELVNRAKGDEGAAGADAAEKKIENIVNTLRQEMARLSEGDVGNILGWANKQITEIERVGAAYEEYETAKGLLADVTNLKIQKAEQDFSDWYAGHIHNDYAKLDAETEKVLRKYTEMPQKILAALPPDLAAKIDIKGLQQWAESAKEGVGWMKEYQAWKMDTKSWEEAANWQKKLTDEIAAASPFLRDQLAWQKEGLEYQLDLEREKLNQYIIDKELVDLDREKAAIAKGLPIPARQMTEELKAQLKWSQAEGEELKRQAQLRKEWETQGISGYAKSWAFDRVMGMDKRGMEEFKSMMSSAESWLGNTFGKSAYNTMIGQKKQFEKLWQDIMSNAVTWAFKQSAKMLGDMLAGAISGGKGKGGIGGGLFGGGGDGGGTPESDALAREWQAIGTRFDAGIGKFDTSTQTNQGASQALTGAAGGLGMAGIAQIGAAAGMGLAAIGILTGSQTLTIVGTVIMMAAQLLMAAAMISMAKWWGHSGGIVAHSGLIVGHGGLNLGIDDVPAILQKKEWVLNRDAAASLAALGGPDTFANLNAGRLPMLRMPVPVPGNFTSPGRQAGEKGTGDIIIHAPITFAPVYNYRPTQDDMDRDARMMVKAINKNGGVGTRGQKLGDGKY